MADNTIVTGYVGSVQPLKAVNDTYVLNFSVGSSNYAGKEGQLTTWFSCQYWGKAAEGVAPYIKVGTLVYLNAQLIPDETGNPKTFEGKTGTRASFVLKVNSLSLLSGGKNQDTETEEQEDEDENDIPF